MDGKMSTIPYRLKNRYFFEKGDTVCYKLYAHQDYMKGHDIDEMEVYLAQREVNSQHFFCREYGEVGEKRQGTCGSHCNGYEANNGKSGVCKHYGYIYSQTDKVTTLTPEGHKQQNNGYI